MVWMVGGLVACEGGGGGTARVEGASPQAEIFVYDPDGGLAQVVMADADGVAEVSVEAGSFVSEVRAPELTGSQVLVLAVGGVRPGDTVSLDFPIGIVGGLGPPSDPVVLDTSAIDAPTGTRFVAGVVGPGGVWCASESTSWLESWSFRMSEGCRAEAELFPFAVSFDEDGTPTGAAALFVLGPPTSADGVVTSGARLEGNWRTDWADVPVVVRSDGPLSRVSVGSSAQPFERRVDDPPGSEVTLTAHLLPLPDPDLWVRAYAERTTVSASWDDAPADVALDFGDGPSPIDRASLEDGAPQHLAYGPVVDSGDALWVSLVEDGTDAPAQAFLHLPPDTPSPLPLPDWVSAGVDVGPWRLLSLTRIDTVGMDWADVEGAAAPPDPYVRWSTVAP
ncbi:MAG: hypothetical protein H6735_28225 [Alphaproteobacteria bacterium]|nr:hypothetical protein [Alphaproteobacteria bacterium]